MPASRAYWKGYLKLSFVSCPIALYPATSAAERMSFRQVNRRTGHRLKQKLFDSVTGEGVEASDKARGYEVGENDFLLVEDRELAQARHQRRAPGEVELVPTPSHKSPPTVPVSLQEDAGKTGAFGDDDEVAELEEAVHFPRPQNTRTIEIEHFLPAGQIDARYFEKPYYILPRGEISQQSFAVIRNAMSREAVSGLARIVLSSRERPFLIEPMDRGLRGVTLRFAHEVRKEADYFNEIPKMKLPPEMMKLAQHIIRTKSADFDPSMLEDHYRRALVRILRRKQAKRPAKVAPVMPARENVVNLMDALRRSLAAERRPKPIPRGSSGKPASAARARQRKTV